ncbi:prepilin-type N-terminal cleavage/methylation domain-containing protein [bacterium]|nr:prepilin-type N-terminal cleavage/methylation domain-containing protein [bacterium]
MKPRGLTLVEMLLAMAISLALMVAMIATFQSGQRLFLSALDAVALSDFQYRVPRELVQRITASNLEQIEPGQNTFQVGTAFDPNHRFRLTPEGYPDWQGKTIYRLSQGQLLQREPWEKNPRALLNQLTLASLEFKNQAYLLRLQTDYQGYTRSYRGEVAIWAAPVN